MSVTQCPQCGAQVEGSGMLCPSCGTLLSTEKEKRRQARATRRQERAVRNPGKSTGSRGSRPHRIWRVLLVGLLALVLFVAVVAGSAYAGLYYGERERVAERESVVQEHYDAGVRALNDGRFELASAEFSYVLQVDPGHALAQQGLEEARVRLEVKPTPTLEAAQSLAEQLFEEAQASYAAEEWVETARSLTQLRALDPAYAQADVEGMLFSSLYNAGIAFLKEDRLEEGISYLDQAIALRPLDAEVVDQRNLAAHYLEALDYWGVDWAFCIERFEALYAKAPDYKDVPQRLYQAHIIYADYFVTQGEMCPAEIQYTEALRMYTDPALEEKRASASQVCLIATPMPVSGTVPSLTPQPIMGFSIGRLAYPVYNSASGNYDLYALYADGRIIHSATNADHPWWEWGTGRMAYRDRGAGGVSMVLPEEGVPLQLMTPTGQAWPTLSPGSSRIAYAQQGADGEWGIYVASTDGTDTPQWLGEGWAPAWSNAGQLAYTGCTADDRCGIILDNPDDGQSGTLLTGSENDLAVSWAPAGNLMTYMSNVTGNWDLFILSPQGGVQQLSSTPSDEGLPVWSPDGSRIAFVSNRDGNWAIYVMQLDGTNTQRILDLGANLPGWESQRLSWAP